MKRFVAGLLGLTLLAASPLMAQNDPNGEIAALRAELARLTARLDQLEQNAANRPAAQPVEVEATPRAAEWPDRIRLSGDLRYRHETINDDAAEERNRHRIRLRMGLTADVADNVSMNVTLATGNDDPISGNQTLDGGFSRKSIGVDRAFFDWNVSDQVSLRGGKMANPFFRPGGNFLIFDADLNPEGLALDYESDSFFANFGGFFVDERSSGEDGLLLASQVAYRGTTSNGVGLTAGASFYDYRNIQGYAPIFTNLGRGNTLDANGNLLYDFNVEELFAEANFEVGGQPLRIFADYVRNLEADTFDTGYSVGLRWRRASEPGSWDVSYAYEDIEANAVYALFTDSDFAGGGTDGKGHVFKADYILKDRLNLGLTYFLNERGEAEGNLRDYNRLQADVSFRY